MPTDDQARKALKLANEIRSQRSALKRQLGAGETNIARILANPPDYAEGMKIRELLLAAPKLGKFKVARALDSCQIGPLTKLDELTDHQKLRITIYLRDHCAGAWMHWQHNALEAAA